MKNIYEVLRQKELELITVRQQLEALKVVAPLLADEGEGLEPRRQTTKPEGERMVVSKRP